MLRHSRRHSRSRSRKEKTQPDKGLDLTREEVKNFTESLTECDRNKDSKRMMVESQSSNMRLTMEDSINEEGLKMRMVY